MQSGDVKITILFGINPNRLPLSTVKFRGSSISVCCDLFSRLFTYFFFSSLFFTEWMFQEKNYSLTGNELLRENNHSLVENFHGRVFRFWTMGGVSWKNKEGCPCSDKYGRKRASHSMCCKMKEGYEYCTDVFFVLCWMDKWLGILRRLICLCCYRELIITTQKAE